jgi:hypothetical protein
LFFVSCWSFLFRLDWSETAASMIQTNNMI